MGMFTEHNRIFNLLRWLVWQVDASYYSMVSMTNEHIMCFERVDSMENDPCCQPSIGRFVLYVYAKVKKVAPVRYVRKLHTYTG